MADVTLTYKGATIAELSESGSKTLETAGKYCEADILLEYVKSGGGSAETLLDSGTITLAEEATSITIPITASGTPTRALVYTPTPISGVQQAYLWATAFAGNDLIGSLVPNGLYTVQAKNSAGAIVETVNASIRLRISSGDLVCSRFNGSYPIRPNTYNWYLWGIVE